MDFYTYNKDFIFMGITRGQSNPRKEGEFLIPANSTPIKMDIDLVDGELAHFDGEKWVKIPDKNFVNRKIQEVGRLGTPVYLKDENGFLINNPDFETLENDIDKARQIAKDRVRATRSFAETDVKFVEVLSKAVSNTHNASKTVGELAILPEVKVVIDEQKRLRDLPCIHDENIDKLNSIDEILDYDCNEG